MHFISLRNGLAWGVSCADGVVGWHGVCHVLMVWWLAWGASWTDGVVDWHGVCHGLLVWWTGVGCVMG